MISSLPPATPPGSPTLQLSVAMKPQLLKPQLVWFPSQTKQLLQHHGIGQNRPLMDPGRFIQTKSYYTNTSLCHSHRGDSTNSRNPHQTTYTMEYDRGCFRF